MLELPPIWQRKLLKIENLTENRFVDRTASNILNLSQKSENIHYDCPQSPVEDGLNWKIPEELWHSIDNHLTEAEKHDFLLFSENCKERSISL